MESSFFRTVSIILAMSMSILIQVQPADAEPIRVTNGAQPEGGTRTVVLEELWTQGRRETFLCWEDPNPWDRFDPGEP